MDLSSGRSGLTRYVTCALAAHRSHATSRTPLAVETCVLVGAVECTGHSGEVLACVGESLGELLENSRERPVRYGNPRRTPETSRPTPDACGVVCCTSPGVLRVYRPPRGTLILLLCYIFTTLPTRANVRTDTTSGPRAALVAPVPSFTFHSLRRPCCESAVMGIVMGIVMGASTASNVSHPSTLTTALPQPPTVAHPSSLTVSQPSLLSSSERSDAPC